MELSVVWQARSGRHERSEEVGKCLRRRGLVTVGVGGGERRAGEVVDVA